MWFKCKASPGEGSSSALWGRTEGRGDQEELTENRTPRKIPIQALGGRGEGFFPFWARASSKCLTEVSFTPHTA